MNTTNLMALTAVLALAGCGSRPEPQASAIAADEASEAAPAGPPPVTGDASGNPDMTELAAQVDTDHDGRMSAAEWKAQGLPETSFKGFEKGRGYVTLEDYQKNPAPPGIDLNGDGKLTIAEFREFDRKMSAQMKNSPAPAAGR